MPTILAYRYKDQLIPKDELVSTKVRKCPFTGKLFDSDNQYLKHLKQLRLKNNQTRLLKRYDDLIEHIKYLMPLQLFEWIENNSHIVLSHYAREIIEPDQYHIKFLEITGKYMESVPNTHSCPRNGVTNFHPSGSDTSVPTGYPGYIGKIRFKYTPFSEIKHTKIAHMFWETGILKAIGIHTGSGSCSNCVGQYDFKMFLDDWPGLSYMTTLQMLQYPGRQPYIKYGSELD